VHIWQSPATTADAATMQQLKAAFLCHWGAWLQPTHPSRQLTAESSVLEQPCHATQELSNATAGTCTLSTSSVQTATAQELNPPGCKLERRYRTQDAVCMSDGQTYDGGYVWQAKSSLASCAQHLCQDSVLSQPPSQLSSQHAFSSQASTQACSMHTVFPLNSQPAAESSSEVALPKVSSVMYERAVILPARAGLHDAFCSGKAGSVTMAEAQAGSEAEKEQPAVWLNSQLELSPENVKKRSSSTDAVAAVKPQRKRRQGMMELFRAHDKRF